MSVALAVAPVAIAAPVLAPLALTPLAPFLPPMSGNPQDPIYEVDQNRAKPITGADVAQDVKNKREHLVIVTEDFMRRLPSPNQFVDELTNANHPLNKLKQIPTSIQVVRSLPTPLRDFGDPIGDLFTLKNGVIWFVEDAHQNMGPNVQQFMTVEWPQFKETWLMMLRAISETNQQLAQIFAQRAPPSIQRFDRNTSKIADAVQGFVDGGILGSLF